MKITKAVIPCGGLGTRFLPITKAVPKELLPIIDAPGVSYIINEMKQSGITDVLLILGTGKEAIKKYFSKDPALVVTLKNAGKTELAESVSGIDYGINISYAYQAEPKGSADAVYLAKSFTGADPFCLAWGDDIIYGDTPASKQLVDAYIKGGKSVVGVQYYKSDDIVKYGVAKISLKQNDDGRLKNCEGFVEKPPLSELPSRYAALGRYVLSSEIYPEIEKLSPVKGELQLTSAINSLCKQGRVNIYDFVGKRYDCGDKLGYIKATIEYALRREFKDELAIYLKELLENLDKNF